jgi:5'-3' exonuclease
VSDNIAGITGIGEKTLLGHFPELKFKNISVKEICRKADNINKERVNNKKKPLKALETLISSDSIERLKTNFLLTNLRKPMLNEQANEELLQLNIPLSPEDRGSKNLYYMMIEDDFLSVYGSTFPNYVEPFYTVIMNEKHLLTEYYKNYKNSL